MSTRFPPCAGWQAPLAAVAALVLFAGACAADEFNLTGIWYHPDGDTYEVRQVGTDVLWYGKSGDNGKTWSHVFRGTIKGKEIIGSWVDVPPAKNRSSGTMTVKLIFDGDIVVGISGEGVNGVLRLTKPDELAYVPKSTKKICQLTGDSDRATGAPTLSQTDKGFGVVATDLGSSFEHKGKLYFLFGDTWGRPGDRDVMAWTKRTTPEKILLDFYKDKDGKWLPLTVPGITQGTFEVPSGGISIAGTMYVVCTTDHSEKRMMGRSVLAASNDDGRTFKLLYDLSRTKFINVSLWLADDWLYIYGSGEYRKSSVCLARVKPTDIGDRSKLEYLAGADPNGQPRWSPREADAAPLFRHNAVGEFSVAYLEPVKRYVMMYNSLEPRGIIMRSAQAPWGPWSQGTIAFEPGRDHGYGYFMHISAKVTAKSDALSDPDRNDEWGGEYGPYIMARFTSGSAGRCRIYYTMSTWNPYQVVVMRSDLKLGAEAK